jgi:hypothetical protein
MAKVEAIRRSSDIVNTVPAVYYLLSATCLVPATYLPSAVSCLLSAGKSEKSPAFLITRRRSHLTRALTPAGLAAEVSGEQIDGVADSQLPQQQ